MAGEPSKASVAWSSAHRSGWAWPVLLVPGLAVELLDPSWGAVAGVYLVVMALASFGASPWPMTVVAACATARLLFPAWNGVDVIGNPGRLAETFLGLVSIWSLWALLRLHRKSRAPAAASPGDATGDRAALLYKTLFDEAPVAMLQEDWSGVKRMVDELKAAGVDDLDTYFEQHPEFFLEARKTHVFLDANQATVRLFGAASKQEFLAIAPQLLPGSPESNIHVVRALARGHAHAQGERLLRTLDGRRVAILWQVNLPEGRADRLLFTATNVDALKATEEALMTAQAELTHAARVAVLGELAASITHEVNQPLGAIRIFADTALRWIDRPEPNMARAKNSIERIVRSAGQAADVVLKMRDFVRKAPPETVPLDVREVLSDTVLLVEREAARQQVTMKVEIEPDLPAVAGDRVQLQQVMVNLVMNAIHALGRRTGGDRFVFIRVRRNGRDAIDFSVADTGPGIEQADLPKLFEPFFSTRKEGLGLGLAICRSIVDAHGGTIQARNRDEGGAVFSFRLPAHGLAH